LALRKAQVATRLPSRALRADAFLTGMGCVLAGLALVSALLDLAGGAGRADAAAALVIGVVLAGEGIRGIFRFATNRD
jgi:divalent metal cation (Fe/Co/Zn/Cd) transporter